MDAIRTILETIKSSKQRGATKLVAIDGLGGSGKSTLVKKLIELDPSLKVVEADKFPHLPEEYPYHQAGAQSRLNIQRLEKEILLPLNQGKKAKFQNTFWWPTEEKPRWFNVAPGGTVLIEGCYSFHKDLRHYYDCSIWVESDDNEALQRAIQRDEKTSEVHWKEVHAPNERNYAAKQRPKDKMDLIVSSTDHGFSILSNTSSNSA